jgi:glycerol kinase
VPVVRPQVTETTAQGAAFLAGLAAGFWKSTGEIARIRQVERVFEPSMPQTRSAQMKADWARAIDRTKGWAAS